MSRKKSIIYDLVQLPWWVSIVLAITTYVGYKFIFPSIQIDGLMKPFLTMLVPNLAPFFVFIFLITGLFSAFHAWRKGDLVDSQTSLKSIKDVSWKDFEFLVSEAYRRKGYQVQENLKAGADGGIDLVLIKDNEVTLVQCKQWKTKAIPVTTIRELYGVMMGQNAQKGVVVCSGAFTKDAMEFAKGKPIELIDGLRLRGLIGSIQKTENISVSKDKPVCPKCNSLMVLRKAGKGQHAGKSFWGCSTYPKCRGVVSI
ncbi:MAG: restriction endonuclease [Woeseiaceae bacterium]